MRLTRELILSEMVATLGMARPCEAVVISSARSQPSGRPTHARPFDSRISKAPSLLCEKSLLGGSRSNRLLRSLTPNRRARVRIGSLDTRKKRKPTCPSSGA